MLEDRYGNLLATTSVTARDHYVRGVDRFLAADAGARDAFEAAVTEDAGFALAHAALARAHQTLGDGARARATIAEAADLATRASPREQAHVAILKDVIEGRGANARTSIVAHSAEYPRDAVAIQPATGVFGIIGFSGEAGRESHQLAFLGGLASAYGDDWWFCGQHAFAEVEAGCVTAAERRIERSLAGNPRNANAAHIKAHIHYEKGEAAAGLRFLDEWAADYDRAAPLHCHVSWHQALWAMEQGDTARAWAIVEARIAPGAAWGPPINVLTDTASFLFRAELAGEAPRPDLWRVASAYAAQWFPTAGVAFADAHAALAHAMAGEPARLEALMRDAKGPAGDMVRALAGAFGAFARGDYATTIAELEPVMGEHERVGGSRAQRDLIEYAMLAALLRLGRNEEAARLLHTRRPARANDPCAPKPAVAH